MNWASMGPSTRRWALLLLAAIWLSAMSWLRPLALPDEGRYVGIAWEMVRNNDWLVPRLDGMPYFHKPPLFYWLTAATLAISGNAEWAARVAPWFGSMLGGGALFLFLWRWRGEAFAVRTLVILATQPIWFVGAQYANMDMLVAGCIGACVVSFAHALLLRAAGGTARGAVAAGWFFAALGVLAKGLIGVVLPGLVIGAWLLVRRDWRAIPFLLQVPALGLFAELVAPWFVAMQCFPPRIGSPQTISRHHNHRLWQSSNASPPGAIVRKLMCHALGQANSMLFFFIVHGQTSASL